jgi:hypothetical protein
MNYKIGDKVRVKPLEWYNKNKNKYGNIHYADSGVFFEPNMSKICGGIVTIQDIDIYLGAYNVEENSYQWIDDMFECLVEEETIQPVVFGNIVFPNENYADKVELCLGDDYEIVVEDGRTFVQRKKPKYPTTYEECRKVLGIDGEMIVHGGWYKQGLIRDFYKLLICRDAYWEIADNWKPDWNNDVDYFYTIKYNSIHIRLYNYTQEYAILAFPTAEMRDAFYENFNDLIEKCEELL